MSKLRWFCLAVTATIALSANRPANADPLWKKLVPSKGVEADPNKDYAMTDDNGPWMIIATTFSGEGARDQAKELVIELRQRYKLEAYTHDRRFDFSTGAEGRGIDRYGQPVKMKFAKQDQIEEIAVLVGNYPTVDDPAAQKTLEMIKTLKPKSLDPTQRKKTNQSLAALRMIQTAILPDGDSRKKKGPMGKAFVSRNPLVPVEFFVPKGVDKFVETINADVEYSLLKCKGKFTVVVATFSGSVVIDPKEVEKYEKGVPLKSRLEKAGETAETLCQALRQKGYEAYVLHDRSASMVTVGSFQSVGSPRADGKIEIDPRIHKIMKTFAAKPRTDLPGSPVTPETLLDIPYDIQPQIVQVPKHSISNDYRASRD